MQQRKLDQLGRVCIPSKFFNELNLSKKEKMEITIEYGEICIKRFNAKAIKKREYIEIVRILDQLNRITLPAEYLDILGIKRGNVISLTMEEETIKIC
ncbi:MAG: hypothetical protein HFJ53_00105 [Clostridia bacterium]|jgi:bifunctional DNA-binding transcriptional regulator/antitoxin component of YhaV-PrlF toxin-antitoxin module|nr:hypothetical protein [Clostridia bacterium]